VSIAQKALFMKYPITEAEISRLIQELDNDTSRRYKNRPLQTEARRAIEFALSKNL